jgi:hypothetical protein
VGRGGECVERVHEVGGGNVDRYDAGRLIGVLVILLTVLLYIAFWGGVIYVAWHFISKYW